MSAVPDVRTVSLDPTDLAVVIASDGVWEVIESCQCAAVVRAAGSASLQTVTEHLVGKSWECWMEETGNTGSDDITALCIQLGSADNR